MNRRPEDSAERFFLGNAESYDHIARVSTLGLDGWWKRKILKKIPKTADRILEQASGTGILTCKIARLLPQCRVIGVELNEEYLNIARNKVRHLELSNVEFIHGRAEDVILKGEFDCIVSDYLAKYVDLDLLVTHAWRMMRKGCMSSLVRLARCSSCFGTFTSSFCRPTETGNTPSGIWRSTMFHSCSQEPGGWMN
jgi:ubiquinone/menaquinone biosynthesis C-methylase UbiE